jgi:hypothetical protein
MVFYTRMSLRPTGGGHSDRSRHGDLRWHREGRRHRQRTKTHHWSCVTLNRGRDRRGNELQGRSPH